jgi:hypothetical protein
LDIDSVKISPVSSNPYGIYADDGIKMAEENLQRTDKICNFCFQMIKLVCGNSECDLQKETHL